MKPNKKKSDGAKSGNRVSGVAEKVQVTGSYSLFGGTSVGVHCPSEEASSGGPFLVELHACSGLAYQGVRMHSCCQMLRQQEGNQLDGIPLNSRRQSTSLFSRGDPFLGEVRQSSCLLTIFLFLGNQDKTKIHHTLSYSRGGLEGVNQVVQGAPETSS